MKAIVRLGSFYYHPNEPEVMVEILCPVPIPGFFLCQLANGDKCIINFNAIIRLVKEEQKENPS